MIDAINQAMDMKAWIEVILAAVIGASTIYFAAKLYRLEKKREQEQHWERQMAVVDDVYHFLDSTCSAGKPQADSLAVLMRATAPMKLAYLFGRGTANYQYLSEIRKRAHQFSTIAARESVAAAGPERDELGRQRAEFIRWMGDARSEVRQRTEIKRAFPGKAARRR
jgi:hypothetical protein